MCDLTDQSSTLIYDLYVAARALPVPEREEYLNTACDPDLRALVVELLSNSEQRLDFLEEYPTACGSDSVSECEDTTDFTAELIRVGMRIGPYQILSKIGEGGMGLVYAAEQHEPVQRRVAIKLIKPGMNTRRFIDRFEAERQALALMQHPNIARVFDAGTLPSGIPFLVMELISGLPLTEFCDKHQLDVRARLRLFIEACNAIQHAHNKGLIHRDIKPSNLLVTDQDGTPTVKVIDFGVAKALSGDLPDSTLHSGLFQIIGTPLYVSPEQIALRNSDVDTRSDVYSLGVVLYELLSGTLPVPREKARDAGLDELLNLICHKDVPRVSRRLKEAADCANTLLEDRQLRPADVTSVIAHELDWIVDKALRKEKGSRYQSPRELASDIDNYLHGRQVGACTHSWKYTLRKTFRRHRRAILLATAAFVLLVAATTVSTMMAFRATRAERDAETSRAAAEANARTLTELLYAGDMLSASGHFMTGDEARLQNVLQRYRVASAAQTDLRGFEWYLLNSQQPVEHVTIQQTTDRIDALALSPNRQLLAIGDSVGRLTLRDADSHEVVAETTTQHGEIRDIEWLGDDRMALCGTDGKVTLWDVDFDPMRQSSDFSSDSEATGVSLLNQRPTDAPAALLPVQEIRVNQGALFALTKNAAGTTLYVTGLPGTLHSIDLETRRVSLVFDRLQRRAEGLSFTAKQLVVGSHDGLIQFLPDGNAQPVAVFDRKSLGAARDIAYCWRSGEVAVAHNGGFVSVYATSPKPTLRFTCPFPSVVQSVDISDDGRLLAAGDATGFVHLMPLAAPADVAIDTDSGRKGRIRSLQAHRGKIRRLVIDGDDAESGKLRILSAANDGTVVESLPFGRSRLQSSKRMTTYGIQFISDSTLVCPNDQLVMLDLPTNTRRTMISEGLEKVRRGGRWNSVLMASNPRQLFVMCDHRRVVSAEVSEAGEIGSIESVWVARPGDSAQRWKVSPSGQFIALLVEQTMLSRHRVEIYRTGSGSPLAVLESRLARDLEFLCDETLLAYVYDNDILIVETETGTMRHRLSAHQDTIRDLAVTPDGELLVSVSDDRTIACWSPSSGQRLWSGLGHDNRIAAVAVHPFLPTLATVGFDAVLRFWRTPSSIEESGLQLSGEYHLDESAASQLEFSPDGRRLVIRHGHHRISWLSADLGETQSVAGQ